MEKKFDKFRAHIIRSEVSQGNKEYYCGVCNKHISRSQCYYHQTCANKEERRYICTICGRKFASKSHLNYHSKTHNNEQCSCMKCGLTVVNSVVLKKHEKFHCKQKYLKNIFLQCNICPKKYRKISALKRHGVKHIERKFECKQCNKQFKRNSSLKAHITKHVGVKFVSCSICCRLLKDNSALHRHLNLHKDKEKYKCTICSTTTSRKDNMLRHLRNMHSNARIQTSFEISNLSDYQYRSYTNENEIRSNVYNSINDYSPKTIENSCVIKYVGNVKPIIIPKETEITSEDPRSHEQYDPIEMYRKILTMTDSTEIM